MTFLCCCDNCGKKKNVGVNEKNSVTVFDVGKVRDFPDVRVPEIICDPAVRDEYAALHYWDEFLNTDECFLCDSVHVNGVYNQFLYGKTVEFGNLLLRTDADNVCKAMTTAFSCIENFQRVFPQSNVYDMMTDVMRTVFYDVNSKDRNEVFYLPFARLVADCDLTDENCRPGHRYDVRMCELNMPGEIVTDMDVTCYGGRSSTLLGEIGKGSKRQEFVIIYFTNPGCGECALFTGILSQSEVVNRLLDERRMKFIAMCIDSDLAEWNEYASGCPESWLCVYDTYKAVSEKQTYSIRAVPCIYLLDGEGRVIFKDIALEKIADFLSNINLQNLEI